MERRASSPAVRSLIPGHMDICTTINATRAAVRAVGKAGKRIGLVPTMGALHEGHLSLVRIAKAQSDFVVVSLFVNPLQFGPKEDLAKYPRSFERDCEMLQREGTDLLFAPTVAEMYPTPAVTYVNVEGLSERLDGQSRPGHFRGVTTVVVEALSYRRTRYRRLRTERRRPGRHHQAHGAGPEHAGRDRSRPDHPRT